MGEQRFPDYQRLKKPSEFGAVYRQNQTRVKGQYFTVLAFSCFHETSGNDSEVIRRDYSRLGVVVSKKVAKQAVRRNRLKRLMRESFRKRTVPSGFDFVAIARVDSGEVSQRDLSKELDKLWRRLSQRCDALSSA